MSAAHALVGALRLAGVRSLFGVPGHGACPISDVLNHVPEIGRIVGSNDQGALVTADGYARATGGATAATRVPRAGVAKTMTNLWEAGDHGSRIRYLLEEGPVHEQLLRPIVRPGAPDELEAALSEAVRAEGSTLIDRPLPALSPRST